MDDIVIARGLHVLAVVIWIGGVGMATMVVLPAVRRGDLGANWLQAFQAIESRFVWYARTATVVVGLSGLYMVARLDLWSRFRTVEYWWMHAMVCLWLLFTLVLFVLEPLVLHRRFHVSAVANPVGAFTRLQRVHWVLLGLSLITVFGAVIGSHGLNWF